jgi:hypothetical protein
MDSNDGRHKPRAAVNQYSPRQYTFNGRSEVAARALQTNTRSTRTSTESTWPPSTGRVPELHLRDGAEAAVDRDCAELDARRGHPAVRVGSTTANEPTADRGVEVGHGRFRAGHTDGRDMRGSGRSASSARDSEADRALQAQVAWPVRVTESEYRFGVS